MDDEISKDELVKAWHFYGARFNVFSPFDQPRPLKWDPEIEEFDEKGLTNPVYLTHWKFLDDTKEFLRERYPHSGILESPSLVFDCLAPMFQKKIKFAQVEHDDYGPIFYDPHEGRSWYTDAIRMDVSFGKHYDGRVGFSCQSTTCQRDRCELHRSNPNRINPVDIYGLLVVFEGISLLKAKSEVGKWWQVELGDLKSSGKRDSSRFKRKVSKQAVNDLLKEFSDLRTKKVKDLIRGLRDLIRYSPSVKWQPRMFDDDYAFIWAGAADNMHKINGPAVKAYIWLLIKQEEDARNTRGEKMSVSDLEVAQGIGFSKRTAAEYREKLTKLRLVEVEEILGPNGREKRIIKAKTRINTTSPT